jgi:predicted DNA binding CopG/RHH family protein
MKKPLPVLATDEDAEEFVANSDLTDYDLSGLRQVKFEYQAKTERINMRLPAPLLAAVRDAAARSGIPYQRYIRQVLEASLSRG